MEIKKTQTSFDHNHLSTIGLNNNCDMPRARRCNLAPLECKIKVVLDMKYEPLSWIKGMDL